jgi:hypothetical protein
MKHCNQNSLFGKYTPETGSGRGRHVNLLGLTPMLT